MAILRCVVVLSLASAVLGFQSSYQFQPLLRGGQAKSLCVPHPRSARTGVCALSAALDRRAFLAAAGVLIAPIDILGKSVPAAHAAAAPSEELVQVLSDGLLRLSGQEPYEGRAVALFSDGSAAFAAAEQAITDLGGKAVIINPKADTNEIRSKYKDSDCYAAFVPDGEVLKEIMKGRGVECERCGYYGDAAPPKWFVVLGNTKKTGSEIQAESNLTGRECDPVSGACFQFGKAIDVYTLPELTKAQPQQPAR